jgi:type IV pilus assembly protein PilC
MEFFWSGINHKGEQCDGAVDALNQAMAINQLHKQGFLVRKITKMEKRRTSLWLWPWHYRKTQAIHSTDITAFTRQLSTMLEAGVSLLGAFESIIKGQTNYAMTMLLTKIKNSLAAGNSLKASLQQHPDHFNDLFCNLVDAGEQSGSLDKILANLASHREKMGLLKKKIKTAFSYPIVIFAIAMIVTSILLLFVIPQFQTLFDALGADLPLATRFVIKLSQDLQVYWYLIFFAFTGLGYGLFYKKRKLAILFLKFPLVGELMKKASIARFLQTLALTYAAGLPLVEVIPMACKSSYYLGLNALKHQIKEGIIKGKSLHLAMTEAAVFPSLLLQMIATGEASGTLEKMLFRAADFYEKEVDNSLDVCCRLLEPVLMCFLGILVGGLVISMYLPIFKLGSIL